MDLSKPIFDSVLQIDERLTKLQGEIITMERNYGFNKIKPRKSPKKLNESLNSKINNTGTRYKHLIALPIESEEIKKIKIIPKISQKWSENFKKKANMKLFYKKDKFCPSYFNENDFKGNFPETTNTNLFFNEYMNKYGVEINHI